MHPFPAIEYQDPWTLWMLRGVFLVLAVFFCWGLYARRRPLEDFVIACGRELAPAAAQLAPLFGSRAVIGGLIMFGTIVWRTSLPPETVNAFTEILVAIFAAFGLVLNLIGRIFAKGPISLSKLGPVETLQRGRETPGGQVVLEQTNSPARTLAAIGALPTETPTPEVSWRTDRKWRQAQVSGWARDCFGVEEATSLPQRGLRLVEEAVEAAQACGCDLKQLRLLVTYVYSRPVGELRQEVGGVGVCLLALADAATIDADAAEADEVARVLAKPAAHFTTRNRQKNDAGFKAAPTPKQKRASRRRA